MHPIWEAPSITAGMILGIIAAFHILPSHLTIGAMWFNVFIEHKAQRKPELFEFIKKYSLLLLIFSYVFGSLSGIGIWFAATVASPRGISALIHNYVWGWAAEWVFFILEITGIFVYYYTLKKVDAKTHLRFAWIFALASWITMVLITGILAFMMTSGKWAETGGFFDGFFNATYWPQLLMRTSIMFVIAAAYAMVVSTRLKDADTRSFVGRSAGIFGLAGLAGTVLSFFWYKANLTEESLSLMQEFNPKGMDTLAYVFIIGMTLYFIWNIVKPRAMRMIPALLAILVVFCGIWAGERTREFVRKPYVVAGYMYSNGFIAKDIPSKGVTAETDRMNEQGIFASLPFIPPHLAVIDSSNELQAGRLIALIECSACHTLNPTGLRPLPQMCARQTFDSPETAAEFLDIIGDFTYMPPFVGNETEEHALGAYLYSITPKGGN